MQKLCKWLQPIFTKYYEYLKLNELLAKITPLTEIFFLASDFVSYCSWFHWLLILYPEPELSCQFYYFFHVFDTLNTCYQS